MQLQLRENSFSQGGQGQPEHFGGGSLGEGQDKVLLDGLREVEIDGQVGDLALQLLEALLEVKVLVRLGEDDLRKSSLGLDLDSGHQSLDILHGRLLVRILLVKRQFELQQGEQVLLGAHRQDHGDPPLVDNLHLLAHLAVLRGGGLVAGQRRLVVARRELDIEAFGHL